MEQIKAVFLFVNLVWNQWILVKSNIKFDYDLFDVESNILFGVAYLKYLIDKFNVEDYAIIAYNAGEGKVSSWIDDDMQIPYKETKNYLKKVKRRKAVFKMLTA